MLLNTTRQPASTAGSNACGVCCVRTQCSSACDAFNASLRMGQTCDPARSLDTLRAMKGAEL